MKLYRHYKQKYYKLYGLAKHSETLTDVAYYECLYDNPSGQFWVRPSELFFGTIDIDGQTTQRFQEVSLEITNTTTLDDQQISELKPLIELVFGEWNAPWFESHRKNHNNFFLSKAYIESQLVGFKLGYQENHRTFYSWIGGVHPEFRRLGIASELLTAQHQWCSAQGFERIRTKSQNRFKGMMLLNLKHGFEIVGTQGSSDGGGLKVIFEKSLIKKNPNQTNNLET